MSAMRRGKSLTAAQPARDYAGFAVKWQEKQMLAIAAAVAFGIALIIHATETSTEAVFAPMSLMLVGLVLLALHVAGLGGGWAGRRR